MCLLSGRAAGFRQDQLPSVSLSLARTMQLALNGSMGWGLARRGTVTAVEVKRGMRWQVEGVREVSKTDRRYAIVGL